jgi:hypothetical protein
MNHKCPSCGGVFEKEPGYFMGAMIAAYFLGILLVTPTLVICLFGMEMETAPAITIGAVQLLIMTPILFRFSRLMWIQIEYQLTDSMHTKK